jgi:signal transduction histidine kinase/CheY-like chemotaxis protein
LIGAQVLKYGAAIVFAAVALTLRWALDPWLGDAQPLSLLFGAIALSVWLGGVGPALLATTVGYVASDYLFIPPRGVFAVVDALEAISLGTYLVSCTIIIGFGEGMRVANRRAKQYARRLEEHQAQLELIERRKDEFLATLVHELRSPLAPIRNAVSLLIPRDPELGMARNIIDRQSRHLIRLVDDLLDMSRIRAGRIRVQKDAIPFAPVLHQAIEAARPGIEAAGHELRVDIPAEPIFLEGDATRLTQIFSNLLNNAARYTPRGGHISLQARREARNVRVTVRDDGIGIPPEMLPHIFEMFMQVDRAAERKGEGLGIGLTLVKKLVELHGGRVEARSEGIDKGSEFVVFLPALAAAPNPYALALNDVRHSQPPLVARDEGSVLIVDNDLAVAENSAGAFSALGYGVHIAKSEAEAVRLGAHASPRAIVVDLHGSDLPGIALCRQLRRYPWGQRALVVAVADGGDCAGSSAELEGVLDGYAADSQAAIRIILDRLPARGQQRATQSSGAAASAQEEGKASA